MTRPCLLSLIIVIYPLLFNKAQRLNKAVTYRRIFDPQADPLLDANLFRVQVLFLQHGPVGGPRDGTSQEVREIEQLVARIQIESTHNSDTQAVKQFVLSQMFKGDAP